MTLSTTQDCIAVQPLDHRTTQHDCHCMGVMGSAEWCTHEGQHIQDSNSDCRSPTTTRSTKRSARRSLSREGGLRRLNGKATFGGFGNFGFPAKPLRGSRRRFYTTTAVCGVLWSGGSTWLPQPASQYKFLFIHSSCCVVLCQSVV